MGDCRMGRLATTMETNSSRMAHSLPVTAPSGPDWKRYACQLLSSDGWEGRYSGRASYTENKDAPDDCSHNDKDDSTEQDHQGSLLLPAEVYLPEKLSEYM